jgi:hypothetical protein
LVIGYWLLVSAEPMKRLYLRLSVFICVLFTLVSPVLAQSGISFTAEVDRTTLSTDDLLTLTLTVAGDYQQLGEPQLPFVSGFDVVGSSRSSQFSMVNGVVSARTVFTYRLRPTGAGTFTIDPVTIVANGSPYQTEPITVQVTQGAAPTRSPEPPQGQSPPPETGDTAPAPEELTGQDIYITADVDNPTPVVGQQIVYRFYFYQAVNLFNQPQLNWPSFSGFWAEDLSPNKVYQQIAANREYRVTEVRRALFATTAGPITIEPAKLVIPGDFFNRDVTLETGPVEVNVQPLPAGAPDGFAGAVGQFEITAWVEPAETQVNEPVTLFVRVSGAGNLSALPDPTENAGDELAEWRAYDAQTTLNVNQDGETIRGEKQFERLLVPRVQGDSSIPSFSLAYFDPQAETYRQVETDPLTVKVAPGDGVASDSSPNGSGKQDVTLLSSDVRHIKAAPPSLAARRTPLLEQAVYWLGWVVPLLAVMGTWAWDRRRRRLSSDVAYARAQRARRLARKQLAQVRKRAQNNQDVAYAAVARALTDYVGDKFNLSPAGLTRDAIRDALARTGGQTIPEELIDRTLACLDWADSGRFAPSAAGRDAGELIAEAEVIIAELERTITT